MFRWRQGADGWWTGIDGNTWYRFQRDGGDSLDVETNGTFEDAVRFFRLEKDAALVEAEIIRRGSELQPAITHLEGIRLMRPGSLTETFFSFMCTANNNLHRIIPMCWKLGAFGEPIAKDAHAFPSVDRIAAIDEMDLRESGFGYRAATIPKAAREVADRGGEEWLEQLRKADYRTLHGELCQVSGIGPKLADCIALYGYDRSEAVPLDTHIWQAFTRLYHPEWREKAVTDFRYREATQRFRDRFGDLSGWAHLYLFYENLASKRTPRHNSV